MIQIEASYSKKLGLPNFSSHSFMVSVRAEVRSLRQLQSESKRLYALLQSSVDDQVKAVGFLPTGNYGMINDSPKAANGSAAQPAIRVAESTDAWRCSEKQRRFIELVAKREKFTSADLDNIAQTVCRAAVRDLDKRQASKFIDELLNLSAPLPFRKQPKRQAAGVSTEQPA
jgi:hypothetical protein